MMIAGDNSGLIPTDQYCGQKVHSKIEAILNKDILFSIKSMRMWAAEILLADVQTCYNRMHHMVILWACQIW